MPAMAPPTKPPTAIVTKQRVKRKQMPYRVGSVTPPRMPEAKAAKDVLRSSLFFRRSAAPRATPKQAQVAKLPAFIGPLPIPVSKKSAIMGIIRARCIPLITRNSHRAAMTATPNQPVVIPNQARPPLMALPTIVPRGASRQRIKGMEMSRLRNGVKTVVSRSGMNFLTIL